jgi:hypothetical protein
MRTRLRALGTAGTLILLAAGCVSRSSAPATSTPPTTSFSSPPTEAAATEATLDDVVETIVSLDADRFNDRICPGSHDIAPVASIGPEYAAARGATIGRFKFVHGERVAAVLDVPAAPAQLLIRLGIDYNTSEWCAHTVMWCPTSYAGLPPFVNSDSIIPEIDQRLVCNVGPR